MTESAAPATLTTDWKCWTLQYYGTVTSTNDLAKEAAPWTVIIAEAQSRGRGRYGRAWQASPGGLWFSAVLPIDDRIDHWSALPLMAGLSVARCLNDHGLQGIRLRWPNDLMVGDRKIAGLLVERISGPRAVIGVGINITNDPENDHPDLAGQATRLADHLRPLPDANTILQTCLDHLHQYFTLMEKSGFGSLASYLDPFWDRTRPVSVTLTDCVLHGTFEGVDPSGALLLRDDRHQLHTLEPNRVTLFRDQAISLNQNHH